LNVQFLNRPIEVRQDARQCPRSHMETTSRIRVSVIIPAFNASVHLGETLDSVFAQTQPAHEVIVVNDGSTDTPQLERVIQPYLGRLVYLKQENRGPSSARNTGILKAEGDFVAFLDSDDTWAPEYLANQVKVLQENPALDLVYSDALLVGEGVPRGLSFMKAAPSNGQVTFESLLRADCSVITSCVVVRKESVIGVGLFDPEFFRSEDFHLWTRLAHAGCNLAYDRHNSAQHRVHHGSLSANAIQMFESKILVLAKLLRDLALSPEQRRAVETEIKRCRADIAFHDGKHQFVSGRYEAAISSLTSANECYRSLRLRVVLIGLRLAPGLLRRAYRRRYGDDAKSA
jgi:glycosyltransferase involved in cell wall biosynthesis